MSPEEFSRPRFDSAAQWLCHALKAMAAGARPFEPQTRAEFLTAEQHGLLRPQWIPGAQGLKMLGLPADFGRHPKPLSENWQERFLSTLEADPDFRAAAALLIGGRAKP
ncbi:MAG: hypothetical protein ACKOEO_27195 [Planctomycetaceae bacterium]